MVKCACGNELHKARVSPYPSTFKDYKTKEEVPLVYRGGFVMGTDGKERCWFCAIPESRINA